jgi:hypothetical protein
VIFCLLVGGNKIHDSTMMMMMMMMNFGMVQVNVNFFSKMLKNDDILPCEMMPVTKFEEPIF